MKSYCFCNHLRVEIYAVHSFRLVFFCQTRDHNIIPNYNACLIDKTICCISDVMVTFLSGSISAVDVNKGRLRILKETAELHELNQVITTVHADLRTLVRTLILTRVTLLSRYVLIKFFMC